MKNVETTGPFSHILCWVDGTEESCNAARYAALLAGQLGAEISYLAKGEEMGPSDGFTEYARIEGVSEPLPPMVMAGVEACLSRATSIATEGGLHRPRTIVRAGSATAAICEAARQQGADLVVLGKQKGGFFERLFQRPVSDALSSQCEFAVLAVR